MSEKSDYSEENTCEVKSFAPPLFNHFSLSLNREKFVVMKAMKKKLNKFTLHLWIYYILE